MDAPDYVLEGERVALGPLRKDLADTYRRWVHDLDVRTGILTVGIYALETEETWVEETNAKCGGAQPEMAAFTVYDLSDGAPIGTTSLMAIDWRLSRSMFGIALGDAPREGARHRRHVPDARLGVQHARPAQRHAQRAAHQRGRRSAPTRRRASSASACAATPSRSWAAAATRSSWTPSPGEFDSPVLAARR